MAKSKRIKNQPLVQLTKFLMTTEIFLYAQIIATKEGYLWNFVLWWVLVLLLLIHVGFTLGLRGAHSHLIRGTIFFPSKVLFQLLIVIVYFNYIY